MRQILADHDRLSGQLSLAVIDDAAIQVINRDYLDHDYATDVLSFLFEDSQDPGTLDSDDTFGEILVSAETALREATSRKIKPERELALYAIHGTLHLVGYKDGTPSERQVMRKKEQHYMAIFEEM